MDGVVDAAALTGTARRIAVVGGGAAALGAAWALSRRHRVTLFERNAYVGGHANTVDVAAPDGRPVAVDTGFIVYNERTYPNLIRLFDRLAVPTRATTMSFAVSLDGGGLEYSGGSLGGLVGQPANLLRPRFLRMVSDILRFYRQAPSLLAAGDDSQTLGDYLSEQGYGQGFIHDHLLPMAAAIWSAPPETMLAFPVCSFVRFCCNHGLLQLSDRPQWRTVAGGSRSYVQRLLAASRIEVRLAAPVLRVERGAAGVRLFTAAGAEDFDEVVIGTHADEALALLADPSGAEARLLGAFRYQENLAVLHGDPGLMPRRRRVWAAWNYVGDRAGQSVPGGGRAADRRLCVTYWMNELQGLPPELPLFVTLNPSRPIRDAAIHQRFRYHHPVFDTPAMRAQRDLPSLQGRRGTWFCGSYFGYGFHEDAFSSGLAVAASLGVPAWDGVRV